ncbi:MAG TPA: glycine radical domain-containing protein, partial [Anaerovoracaceae bacterium]|nr:glycine radical domain-containing protein [Anaerovoracaceae bacterium]
HYGNDDDYADEMMTYVMDSYCDLIQSYPPSRGKWKFATGSFTQVVNVLYGAFVGATPDGRKAHEAVSANIEACRTYVTHRDLSGPTALARSIGKFDHAKCATGTLVNVKFGTETVSGEQGRENLVDYLDGYFAQDPMHIQVMVTNRDTLLEARAHPEEYQDLVVRVSGFSSYFHALSERLQDELIERTEHEL